MVDGARFVKQQAFEHAAASRWRHFDEMLVVLEHGGLADGDFPLAYRRVCQDLALARDRQFGSALVDQLNDLALRGHQQLYGSRVGGGHPVTFLLHRFPAAVRREARAFFLMTALFYGAALLVFALDLRDPDLIYHLLDSQQVEQFEQMYDPAGEHYGAPRDSSGDFAAFAFYVRNNVSVAFRTFASGIFLGIGSLLAVAMNGLYLGLVAAHLTQQGHVATFYPFVIGHGAFELTAIVLSGAAGWKLGLALFAPGRLTRRASLARAARRTVPLLYGASAMLGVAAVLEAFWSSSIALPIGLKLGVGAALWGLVVAWLGLGGRSRDGLEASGANAPDGDLGAD